MSSLEEINRQIEEVHKDIEKVIKGIEEVKAAIKTLENDSVERTNNNYIWERRLKRLDDELRRLGDKEKRLGEKENQLQAQKTILLEERKRQSDRGSAVDYNNNFHLDSPEHVNYAKLKAIKLMPYLATLNGHCVTIVSRNLFVTYAHHSHANLVVGTKCNNQARSSYPAVKLYNGTYVNCSVIMASKKLDCVWLKPDNPEELPSEIQEQQIELPYYCHKIIIMGLSGLYQIETPISFDICNISCSTPDESGHVKSNKKSSPGESGGPVFDFYNGRLVGMQVSSECSTGLLENNCGHYGGKATIVPAILFFDYSDKNYDELNVVKPVSFASRVNVRTQSDSFETLRKKMKEILGNRVQDVIVSEDLISSQMPCFINLRNDVRNLEINPNHSAIVSLNNKVNEGSQDSLISHLVNTLFDESLCR